MTATGPDPTGFSPSGRAPGDNDAGDGIRNLADAAARMLDGYARVMAQVAGGAGIDGDGRPEAPRDGAPALAEAWVIASGSALRYGQGLSEVFARHQGAMIKAASAQFAADGPTVEQKLAEIEELRRFLREIGEVAVFEARRLEQELAGLGEAVARDAAERWPDDANHRVWATKP